MNNLDSLQRYGCCSVEAEPMYEDEEGEWVKFADVKAMLEAAPGDVKAMLEAAPGDELKQCRVSTGHSDCQNSALPGSIFCAEHSCRRSPWSK